MCVFILLGLSQNLREGPSQMNTIFIGHFSRVPEVGAKVEQAVLRASAPADF
jgi:hypothetical protein